MYGFIFLLIIGAIFLALHNATTVLSRWQNTFSDFNFSSQEFYTKVQEVLTQAKIPDVDYSHITFSRGGMMSANQDYLRIKRNEFVFYICASPFGTGFFVSTWLVERPGALKTVLRRVRFIKDLIDIKTYYSVDTESMYKGSVQSAVRKVIEEITSGKGVRGLSELEWKPVDNPRLKW